MLRYARQNRLSERSSARFVADIVTVTASQLDWDAFVFSNREQIVIARLPAHIL